MYVAIMIFKQPGELDPTLLTRGKREEGSTLPDYMYKGQ